MPVNSLSPGYLEVKYTYSNLLHRMRIPVQPAAGWVIGTEPSVVDNGGNNVILTTAMNNFLTPFRAMFANTTEVVSTDAWFYPLDVNNPVWVYTLLHGVQGTNTGTNTPSSQMTVSFRTSLGGIAKLVMLEGVFTPNVRNSYPFGAGALTTLMNQMLGTGGIWRGRDGGKLVSPIWSTSKTNDAVRKVRLSL